MQDRIGTFPIRTPTAALEEPPGLTVPSFCNLYRVCLCPVTWGLVGGFQKCAARGLAAKSAYREDVDKDDVQSVFLTRYLLSLLRLKA